MPMNRRGSVAVIAHSPLVASFKPSTQEFASPRRDSVIDPNLVMRPNASSIAESEDLMSRLRVNGSKPEYVMTPEGAIPSVLKTGIMQRQHPYCPHCGHHVQVVDNSATASESESSNRSRSNSSQIMNTAEEVSPPITLLSPMSFQSATSSQRRACAPLPTESVASLNTPADWRYNNAPRSASLTQSHPPLVSPREKRRLTRQLRAHSEINTNELRQNVAQWMQQSADVSPVPAASFNTPGHRVEETQSEQGKMMGPVSPSESQDSGEQPGSAPASLVHKPARPNLSPARRLSPIASPAAAMETFGESAMSTPTEQPASSVGNLIDLEEASLMTPTAGLPTASKPFPFLDMLPGPGYLNNEPERRLSNLYLRRQARQSIGADATPAPHSPDTDRDLSDGLAHTDDSPPELVSHIDTSSSCESSRRPSHASTFLLSDTAMHKVDTSTMSDKGMFASHVPMASKIPDHDDDDDELFGPDHTAATMNFATGKNITHHDLMSSLAESIELPVSTRKSKRSPDTRRHTFTARSRPVSTITLRQQSRDHAQAPPVPTVTRSVKFQTADDNALLRQSRLSGSVDSLLSDSTAQTVRRRASGNASGLPAPLLSADIAPATPVSRQQLRRTRGYSLSDSIVVPDINNFVSSAIEEQAAIMTSRPVSVVERERRGSQGEALHGLPKSPATPKSNRFSRRFSKIPDGVTMEPLQIPAVPPMPAGILRQPPTSAPHFQTSTNTSKPRQSARQSPPPSYEPKTPPRSKGLAERAMSKAGESATNAPQSQPRRRASFANLIRSHRSSSVSKVAIPGVTPK